MSQDDKLIDFAAERDKRIHDLHDKKLADKDKHVDQKLQEFLEVY